MRNIKVPGTPIKSVPFPCRIWTMRNIKHSHKCGVGSLKIVSRIWTMRDINV